MAKKAGGTATAEAETRGRLPGEVGDPAMAEVDSVQDEPTATMPAKIDGPIATMAELVVVAATYTPEAVAELRASGHQFTGVWPGSSLNVKVKLTPEASDTFRRAYLALNRSNARLADGTHVGSIADTLRWMMERLTDEVSASG